MTDIKTVGDYTPGPWFHHGPSGSQHTMGGYINSSQDRNGSYPVCSIFGTNGQPYEENARLICAAPDMLEALDELRKAFILAVGFSSPFARCALEKSDAAIAKARGES